MKSTGAVTIVRLDVSCNFKYAFTNEQTLEIFSTRGLRNIAYKSETVK